MYFKQMVRAKEKIMTTLDKAIDEIFTQLEANEKAALENSDPNSKEFIDLQPDQLNVKFLLRIPVTNGTTSEFSIYCNPVIKLTREEFFDKETEIIKD